MLLSKSKRPGSHEGVGGSDERCWEHDRHEALAALRLQFCFSNGQGDYRNFDAIRRTDPRPKEIQIQMQRHR